ncbi:MAG: hypothetical protein EU533_08595 [Promethearchaeota archaeon]|nr:MAG: hypothetical protein EU533_08595 [Candidatus Lokiarchaeota archaeon]
MLNKESKLKFKTFAYSLIGFLLLTGIFIFNREYSKNIEICGSDLINDLRSSANSGKIHINNNWTATKTAGICTGEGTESNPYLLENLVIDAGGVGNAIQIENTTQYFEIKNCTLFNAGLGFDDSGISLLNVRNGRIINNTMYGNVHGMSIDSCLNLKIVKNKMINNQYGLGMVFTNESIFYLNSFALNSIVQFASQWSYIDHYSKEKFSYTYNGRTFTNYLGNYWGGYSGLDEDGDGIGDTPYIVYSYVPDNPDLKDFYPLIEPISAYSNITKAVIPGFNLISLLAVAGLITILLTITYRKSVNKLKIESA